ncbi:MAG: hypothetical protein U0V70_18890 [Terriglobia bacterium]
MTEFVKVEKSIISLGFFTPSHKRISGVKKKTIVWNRQSEGQRIEVRAVILPSSTYGLPVTSDQDKYLAFQKILADIRRQQGEVRNPVGFTTADLLRVLGLNLNAGKNYDDVVEWGKRMTLTGICSEGSVYFAGQKCWATDTFHVFERFVSVGNQMPDGKVADQNYIWLSEWQLENINRNYLLPIDLETYRQLKNHIAKALVPLLQVWLYASLQVGFFEKRYRDLCQILNVTEYKHFSKISEKLGPSLNELKKYRYLSDWRIQPTSDGTDFKIVLVHGEKFKAESARARQLMARESSAQSQTDKPEPPDKKVDRELLHQLMKRGISETVSISLLKDLKPDQHVMDQLEWGDHLVLHSPNKHKFFNPAGLYVYLIKDNAVPPETFESNRRRSLREAARQTHEKEEEQFAALQLAYMQYQEQQVDRFVQANPEEFLILVEAKKAKLSQETHWKRIFAGKQDILQSAAERQVRADLLGRLGIMNLDAFCREKSTKEEQQNESSTHKSESLPIQDSQTPPSHISESVNR